MEKPPLARKEERARAASNAVTKAMAATTDVFTKAPDSKEVSDVMDNLIKAYDTEKKVSEEKVKSMSPLGVGFGTKVKVEPLSKGGKSRKSRPKHPRIRTYRRPLRGGATLEEKINGVKKILEDTPITSITPGKPESRYVVATYWWGKANINRNLQFPCVADIQIQARNDVFKENPKMMKTLLLAAKILKKYRQTGNSNTADNKILKAVQEKLDEELKEFAISNKEIIAEKQKILLEKIRESDALNPRSKDRTFLEMINDWNTLCSAAEVNHIALNTEFPREYYQVGINVKPLFIKKLLDFLKEQDPENPKGVLYIDGDMSVLRYPTIFDIEGVDFMASGWNSDTRGSGAKKPYYNPMIFETSGGTMYFGNTLGARRLLDAWATSTENPKQEGKADDRILSQEFTTKSMVLTINIINLPIEYLWLTDKYVKYEDTFKAIETKKETALIEHPYCLTGEEQAAEQGAAKDREPNGYYDEITDVIDYKAPKQSIYEYIMFNGHQTMRDEMGPYLKYLGTSKNFWTQEPIATLVPFEEKYGNYNVNADLNLKDLPEQVKPTGVTESVVSKNVKEILTKLRSGINVWTGEGSPPAFSIPDIECYGVDSSTRDDNADPYTRFVQINTDSPIFFSASSPILQHLLIMCEKLEDINIHLKMNYMFLSRIRWELTKPEVVDTGSDSGLKPGSFCVADFPKILNQIWFGGNEPGWRQTLFEKNKALCESRGYTYKLWRESDRTKALFPMTFAYQETARGYGNTRWAQIADLARLEIIYESGGIYVDSIIELTPAFFMAIEKAIKKRYLFIGCNEDACDPFGEEGAPETCKGADGKPFLTNGFFASTRGNRSLLRLLDDEVLDKVDFEKTEINQETGPYFLRKAFGYPVEAHVFMLDSSQMYPFNEQESQSKKITKDIFISGKESPGAVKVKDGQYFTPGGTDVLQREFLKLPEDHVLTEDDYKKIVEEKGLIAIYHSGLGGTWSPD
jgi:hypothetical protein